MSGVFGQSHSLLTRMKRHGQITVMFRAPADRLQGDLVDPNLPVQLADYRLAGIVQVIAQPQPVYAQQRPPVAPIRQTVPFPTAPIPQPTHIPAAPVPQPARVPVAPIPQPTPVAATFEPVPLQTPTPMPVAAQQTAQANLQSAVPASAEAADQHEKLTRQMIGSSLTEYRPPREATENQLMAIVNAHQRKQESGEPYEVQINTAFVKKERPKDGPVGKANLRRHVEAKERLAKEGIDLERLRQRPTVSYLGDAALKPSPQVVLPPKSSEKPKVVVDEPLESAEIAPAPKPTPQPEPPSAKIDADSDLLDMMDGETVDRPMVAERSESEEKVLAELRRVSAEQNSNSSIDLVLPRRARPTQA